MTEREKMLSGELYNSYLDKTLKKDRVKARDLCYKFNKLKPSKIKKQEKIINKLFGKVGKNFDIHQPFMCDYGYNIEIGDGFFSNYNLTILDANKVTFGDNVFIAPNCAFYTAGHPLDYKMRNEDYEYAKEIKVGNNVWIGGNTVVLPGVTIGDNVVIGAGSIVTKDIPSNSLAYGNPCKVMKELEK